MPTAQITWQDVQQLPDDGKRYEAIEGELYVTAAPSYRHQRISALLHGALLQILEYPGHGHVTASPVGVEFPASQEGVQPDLIFISNARRAIEADDWIRGAPDLVVEILSPSTAHRDRGVKHKLYQRQGVREYWLVHPQENVVDVWRFGAVPEYERFTDRLPVRVADEEVGTIDLNEIFKRY